MSFFSSTGSFIKGLTGGISIEGIKKIIADLGTVFQDVKNTFNHLTGVFTAGQTLFTTVKDEIAAWKNFRQDIRISSRVVNLEIAIRKTRDLIAGIPASWRAALDIVGQIKKAIAKDVAAEEGAAVLAVETAGLSEIVVAIGIVYQVLSFVADMISDLQTIVDETKRLRLEIEKLDTIFLAQSNKRKTLKLADGSSIRIRTGGKLHP
jgi:hypothetical protein